MELSNHKIYINTDGVRVPSVTSIIKLLNKPALLKWSNYLGFRRIRYEDELSYRAKIGTLTHYMIQTELSDSLYVHVDTGEDYIKEAINRYYTFMEWGDEHPSFKCIETELSLTGDKYGGTIDCYCEFEGKRTILDWKTGKSFYDSMFLQLVAYSNLLKEKGERVDQVGIVLLGNEKYTMRIIELDELTALKLAFDSLLDLYYNLDAYGYNV